MFAEVRAKLMVGSRTKFGMTAFFAGLALSACATPQAAPPPVAQAPQESRAPVTILVSIDGFRPDYLDRGVTPNLSRLAATGVTGPMHPSFPSKTFPNHYTLVTGLRPDHHGIVANKMEDERRPGETFTMASDDPFWWNEAAPLWVNADQAGVRTATMFWPGANVAIGGVRAEKWPNEINGGVRPDDWQQYNEAVTGSQRVNAVLDWLRRPAAIRPAFLTLYFDTVDTAGHHFGPGDARTTAAVADVDARIGELVAGLAALGQPANLVLVSDHGMAATSSTRTIALDSIANPADYRIVEAGPYAALAAIPGHETALEKRLLAAHAHMACWRRAEIPARFAYGKNPRVPPYLCLADTGWTIAPSTPKAASTGGNHGYDNMADDMTALFIAYGPAFAVGRTIPAFDNVDVQPMLAALLGIAPGVTDGSLKTWNAVRK
jgi:predicted AlkP superfamily pyrophosphatase or phosphodiesterase